MSVPHTTLSFVVKAYMCTLSGEISVFFRRSSRNVCGGAPVNSMVDVTKLREDLLLKLERERSEEVAGLRSKQKQVWALGNV